MTASPVDRVVVVLGAGADDVMAGVDPHGADYFVCGRWDEGQSASLACGLAELKDCEAAVITLGDQPRLSPLAVQRVIAARAEGVDAIRATYGGGPGYPVLLEHRMFERMRDVTGDHGARNLLLSVPTREVPCDDLGGGEDVVKSTGRRIRRSPERDRRPSRAAPTGSRGRSCAASATRGRSRRRRRR